MTKKLVAIILALLLSFSVCAVAFAVDGEPGGDTGSDTPVAEEGYDYTKDESLQADSEYRKGEFVFGRPAACMYNVTAGKAVTLEEADELGYIDEMGTTSDTASESVKVVAFYAFRCPACGKANGGQTLYDIYYAQSHPGKCAHCDAKLPDPKTVDVYRFLIVDPDSVHVSLYSDLNFVNRTKDIFGSTASQYAGGKDLPQSFLIYESVTEEGADEPTEVFTDFKTSGLGLSSARALFYLVLTRYQLYEENHLADETTIKIYNAMADAMVKFIEAMGVALRFIPGLIF